MKKLSRNTIILICVGASVWLLLTGLLIFNTLSERWRHSPDFKNYADDFTVVADLALSEYRDMRYEGDERLEFLIGRSDDGNYYISNNNVIVHLSSKQQQSLNNIIKSFTYEYSYPSEIIVYENRVSFHEVSKQYALVYTVDGTKPDFLYKPTDNIKIHVRKIKENWYDVAE